MSTKDRELTFLLVGKTGEGKSATGNSILGSKCFKASCSHVTETRDVSLRFSEFGDFILKVIDCPGLLHTDLGQVEDLEHAVQNMNKALYLCPRGIDAFLLVLRFDSRFTRDERRVVDILRNILGENFFNHVIVILTCGDVFQMRMEEEERDLSFQEWCREQTGELQKLYQACNGRFMLFNNRDTFEGKKQVQELAQMTENLRAVNGCYDHTSFARANAEREKFILEAKTLQFREHMLYEVRLLYADLDKIVKSSSKSDREKIENRITDLKSKIKILDKGYNVMKDLLKYVESAESYYHRIIGLHVSSKAMGDARKTQQMKDLTLLLMGKTGHGKSSTGNSILDRKKAFKVSSYVMSQTKKVTAGYAKLENYKLKVVDSPGLADTDKDNAEDLEQAARNMDQALAECSDGVDAFLFVFRYGCKFTREEKDALEALKQIFGGEFFNHLIIVITGGDSFLQKNFESWCKKQEGEFRKLYESCGRRCVLFNNNEQDEKKKLAQRKQLFEIVDNLKTEHGRYTARCFKIAKDAREELILERRAPQLKERYQRKIDLIVADIDKLIEKSSSRDIEKIGKRIRSLNNEIEIQDKGFGVLTEVQDLLKQVTHSFNDVHELPRLRKKLNKHRKAKEVWFYLNMICSVCVGVLTFTPIGLIGRAVGAVATLVTGAGDIATDIQVKLVQEDIDATEK